MLEEIREIEKGDWTTFSLSTIEILSRKLQHKMSYTQWERVETGGTPRVFWKCCKSFAAMGETKTPLLVRQLCQVSSVCGLRALPWTARTAGGGATTWGGGSIRSCVVFSRFWASTGACGGTHAGPKPWIISTALEECQGKMLTVNKLLCVTTALRTAEEMEMVLWCPEPQWKQGKKQNGDVS